MEPAPLGDKPVILQEASAGKGQVAILSRSWHRWFANLGNWLSGVTTHLFNYNNPHQTIDENLQFSDVTDNDASASKHGFLRKLSNVATQFLDGKGQFDTVKDTDLSTSDNATNNVSTSKHGFCPKAPNDVIKYLRGDGTWATVAAVLAIYSQAPPAPNIPNNSQAIWFDTLNTKMYLISNVGGVQMKVELT